MRRSVPSWAQGGTPVRRRVRRTGADCRCGLFRQRRDHCGRGGLRDAEPLCQGGQGAGGRIAEGAQGRQQHGQEDVDPLIRFALAHAEQASLDHLERVGLQVGQEEEEAIFRCRQGQCL